MKKNYLKPQTNSVNMEIENYILNDSNTIGFDPNPGTSAANESRGEWGNVWK